ncbi:hypothetical protein FOC33_16900 [Plesiomonas shigelloides]|uniref:hypothetical protein n=1 Tax=Plesiomonas shigelloides TaxID=703 RepID=UPI00143E2E1F|nr:hypothetical protein [Plesiomonas shigelloides]QIY10423.1 hypothetical protein FOC33_16900 [Plesiomonas shigelloides]
MNEVLKSIKENATSRMKNPIIGAFVLSWIALNINGVAKFILVSSSEKIKIIESKQWILTDDIIFPFLIATVYLLLLPVLNIAYEKMNDGYFNLKRSEIKNETAQKIAEMRKKTVSQEVEADVGYIRILKEKQVETWVESQSIRNREIIALKAKHSKFITSADEKVRDLQNTNNNSAIEIKNLRDNLNEMHADQASQRSVVEDMMSILDKTVKDIENQSGSASNSDLRKIKDISLKLRQEFMVWDDIPF